MSEQQTSNQCDELVRLLRQRYQDEGDTTSRKAADEIERLRGYLREIADENTLPSMAAEIAREGLADVAPEDKS